MNPLVIALGEKSKRSEDELSIKSGEVFESIPASNTQTKSGGVWVQGKKSDGNMGWYPKEYTEKMVKYRINQFGVEKQKKTLEEKRQMENLFSGYKVRTIVSREAMKDDEISLSFMRFSQNLSMKWSQVGVEGRRMVLLEFFQQGQW